MSIFSRISVMNLWCDGGWRYAWRFLLMPIGNGIDDGWKNVLGYTTFQFFGFAFFWHHKLTPEQEKLRASNNKKLRAWVEKNGERIK